MKTFLFAVSLLVATPAMASDFDTIIEHHRKMIVLLDGAQDTDPLSPPIFAARNEYAGKHEIIERITSQAEQASRSPRNGLLPQSIVLLDYVDNNAALHKADLLAFMDLADELLEIEKQRLPAPAGLEKLRQLNQDIEAALETYRKEYTQLLNKFEARGRSSYETWAQYLAFIKSRYPYESLLSASIRDDARLYRQQMRGTASAKTKQDNLKNDKPKIVWGNRLPKKTVVLTFDDGPSHSLTPKILDILKQYKVNGYFFSVGKNLGSFNKKGVAEAGENEAIAKRIIKEGHVLANHSYSHPVLTKLSTREQEKELERTAALIKLIDGKKGKVFRPPYGSQDDGLKKVLKSEGLISVMWNVDSLDWADPIPESIADRVLRTLDKQKRGILLFHDIHKQTIKALPDILAGLNKRGFKVVTLAGNSFDDNLSGIPQLPADTGDKSPLYRNSWAVVIGINDYKQWPKLRYAVNDARSVAEALRTKLGFPAENIIELYDGDATGEKIREVLGYQLADPKKVSPNDRVFVFYAGHGMTRELPGGGELGYIIPADAELSKYQNQAISMSQLDDFSSLIPAKHLYYVMDSCYSGLALTRAGMSVGQSSNYLQQVTQRRARQILTAGGADQQVSDNGPGGHSVFTWTLLQGLEGLADTDNNGYITASELGTYVAPVVSSYADQTPAFGNLVGSKGGDFVFEVDAAAIASINQRLTDEAARIEAELKQLRNNAQAQVRRRLELEVAMEKAGTATDAPTPASSKATDSEEDRIKQAHRLNASALMYFKEKRYELAREEWEEAVRLNPYNPTIVNNYAFVLDQLDENEKALKWYYRTIELDAKRIPLYLNLGDIMVELGRPAEAIPYYERYLHLYPSYKKAKELRKKIKELAKSNTASVAKARR